MIVLRHLRAALAGLFVVAAAWSAPAFAQQPKPADASPSPSHVAVARDVIVASGISRTFDGMVKQTLDQYVGNVLQTRKDKDLENDLKAAAVEVENGPAKTEVSNMQVAAAILLTKRMTEDELKQVLAFLKTPAGAKYVEMQPLFLDNLVVAIDGWSQRVMPQMVDAVRQIVNKKGYSL